MLNSDNEYSAITTNCHFLPDGLYSGCLFEVFTSTHCQICLLYQSSLWDEVKSNWQSLVWIPLLSPSSIISQKHLDLQVSSLTSLLFGLCSQVFGLPSERSLCMSVGWSAACRQEGTLADKSCKITKLLDTLMKAHTDTHTHTLQC